MRSTRWQREIDRFEAIVGDHRLSFFQLDVLLYRAVRAFLAGDLQRAEGLAFDMVPLARSIGRVYSLVDRFDAPRPPPPSGAGRRAACAGSNTSSRTVTTSRDYHRLLAAVQARMGSTTDALDTLVRLRADGFAIPENYPWALAMTELAEAADVAGDPDTARHVLAACKPYSGRIALSGACVNRPFDQALAQAALAVDDAGLAEHYAARAVTASRERNTPVYLCRELVFLAESRRRDGATPTVTSAARSTRPPRSPSASAPASCSSISNATG